MRAQLQDRGAVLAGHPGEGLGVRRWHSTAAERGGRVVRDAEDELPGEPGGVRSRALCRWSGQGARAGRVGADRTRIKVRGRRGADQRVSKEERDYKLYLLIKVEGYIEFFKLISFFSNHSKRRGAINAKQLSYLEKYRPKSRLKHKNGHKNSCCVQ